MSSSAVYGASTDNPIRETSTLAPQTDYAVSKVCTEMMTQVYSREGRGNAVIARPFNIVGPGQRAPLLYSKVAAQIVEIQRGIRPPVLELGNLESHRDFIDVRDVCDGLIAIAEHGKSGETYNLCSGRATPIRYLVEYLCGKTGRPVNIRTIERTSAGVDIPYQRGAHEKIATLCGWRPAIKLEKSLDDTLVYWQELSGPSR
jgi:GDP-4-dehydro-6-deoxy-D-mannose reductase